jgi:2',5'-phosphodiesterase
MVAVRSEFCRVRRASDSRSHIPLFNLLSQHDTTKESAVEVPAQRSDNDLRIVSYNILAEPFATSEQAFNTLYPYCDQAYLQSEYRIQRILCELIAYDADVICLQECDLKTFECYLLPILGRLGYAGHFTCKGATEGCAVFTLTTTCTVAARVDLPLKNVLREASYLDTLYEQRPDLRDILGGKLGTVAQLTVLQCVHRPEQALVVANTHLFYHPLASFLRAIQAHAITQALETLCKRIETVGVTHDLTSLVGGEETNTVMLEKEARIEKSLFTNGWVQSSTSIVEDSAVRPLRATAVFCGDLNSSPNFATMNFLLR